MGRLRFELRTSRLKAGCSTAELATHEDIFQIENITVPIVTESGYEKKVICFD